MSFHLYFFAIFISLWGSTHDSADCWTGALTDPRLPATASNVCTTDGRLGGVGRVTPPPKQKSWLRPRSCVFSFVFAWRLWLRASYIQRCALAQVGDRR